MSIININHHNIVEDVNKKNALELTVEELIFSNPSPNDGGWSEGVLQGNTLMRLTPTEESDFIGTTVVAYDRITMTNLHTLVGGTIRCPEDVTTVHEALPYIEKSVGVKLYIEDVLDQLIDRTDPDNVTVELAASPTSVGWIGEATFDVKAVAPSIGSAIDPTSIHDVAKISDAEKLYAESLVYWVDFSQDFDYLSTLNVGDDPNTTEMVNIMKRATGQPWTDYDYPQTLLGAEIVFAGLNDGSVLANNNYKYVIHIEVNKTGESIQMRYEGNLIIHFNDPDELDFDPGEV